MLEQVGPRRLLVVTDEAGVVGMVQRHADSDIAISAAGCADVRQACAEQMPHAVLFDVPAHLGRAYEALKQLQLVRGDLPATPMLVLAWQRLPEHVVKGLWMLEKPFSVAALREAIERLMRTDR
jgi:DNA-binding NtrC family response regulator